MIQRITKLFAVSLLSLLPLVLSSCGGVPYTDDEVLSAAEELVVKSFELNDIYFGEGLPISDNREDVERFYASISTDVESVNFHPVADDCPYQSEEDIKKATEAVFSQGYCEYLFDLAFTGLSTVLNEGTELQYTATASYARYIETNGVLTVRIDLPYEAMELTRTYDFDSMEIVRKKKNYAVVSVTTKKDGAPLDIDLKLIYTAEGFRLDTPTY